MPIQRKYLRTYFKINRSLTLFLRPLNENNNNFEKIIKSEKLNRAIGHLYLER